MTWKQVRLIERFVAVVCYHVRREWEGQQASERASKMEGERQREGEPIKDPLLPLSCVLFCFPTLVFTTSKKQENKKWLRLICKEKNKKKTSIFILQHQFLSPAFFHAVCSYATKGGRGNDLKKQVERLYHKDGAREDGIYTFSPHYLNTLVSLNRHQQLSPPERPNQLISLLLFVKVAVSRARSSTVGVLTKVCVGKIASRKWPK